MHILQILNHTNPVEIAVVLNLLNQNLGREKLKQFYRVWLSIQLPWQLVLIVCPPLLFNHRESERSRGRTTQNRETGMR